MVINTIPTDPKNSCFGGPKAIRRYGTRRLGTTTFPGFVLSGFQSRNVIATFSATFLQLVLTSGQKLVNNSMVEKLLVDREASNRQKRSKPSKKKSSICLWCRRLWKFIFSRPGWTTSISKSAGSWNKVQEDEKAKAGWDHQHRSSD